MTTSRFVSQLALPFALLAAPVSGQSPAPPDTTAASAQLQSAAEGIAAVLQERRPAAEVFAPAFLAAVPPEKLAALTAQIAAQFGPLEGLDSLVPSGPTSGVIGLRFARAVYSGPFSIDAQGKVTNLLLNDYRPLGDDAASIERDLAALPGVVGAYYGPLDGSAPIVSVNADRQFALGSTFKLYVLAALAKQVESGTRHWDDVVRIDAIRSLPSGQMQDWPEDAPVTLQTLATMMISISDNTATDQLIHIMGREALNAEVRDSGNSAPQRTLPFLTTRELFALKADPGRGAKYAALPEEQQAAALAALAQEISAAPETIARPDFSSPVLIDEVEWFASAADLRKVLGEIADLKDPTARAILAVSPSIPAAKRNEWAYAGFKGGSEPGVLNLTWLLQTPGGEWRILTMSWNNPANAVDASTFELLSQRIMALP
jgi:beta-lactamase class A